MEICSIRVKLNDGKEFDVPIEDARSLYEKLHALFGGREKVNEWTGLRAAERQYVADGVKMNIRNVPFESSPPF